MFIRCPISTSHLDLRQILAGTDCFKALGIQEECQGVHSTAKAWVWAWVWACAWSTVRWNPNRATEHHTGARWVP